MGAVTHINLSLGSRIHGAPAALHSKQSKTEKVALTNLTKDRVAPHRRLPTKKVKELGGFQKKAVVENPKVETPAAEPAEQPKFAGRKDPKFIAALNAKMGQGRPVPKKPNTVVESQPAHEETPPAQVATKPVVIAANELSKSPAPKTVSTPTISRPSAEATAQKTQATVSHKGLFGTIGAIFGILAAGAITAFMMLSGCCLKKNKVD